MSILRMLKAFGAVLATSLLLGSNTSLAQKRPDSSTPSTNTTRNTILSREIELENRELTLRLLNEPEKTGTPPATDDRKLIVSQIFKDFERIQVINREMMQTSSSLDIPAYKRISALADEMNKRARRLKSNLAIPDWEDKKTATEPALAIDAGQLKASLLTLNTSVKSFVTNPLFKEPRVTDVRLLNCLRRDISNVIDLSRTVKKLAVELHH